jgi:hypothetical protein
MTRTSPKECRIVPVERRLTAVVKAHVSMDKLPEAQMSLRGRINAALPQLDVGPVGPSCTLWRPPADGRLEMEPGVIITRAFAPFGDVVPSSLPAGRAAHFRHAGPYEGIPGAWQTLFAWCSAQRLSLAGVNWEIYGDWNDDPMKLETSMYALLT